MAILEIKIVKITKFGRRQVCKWKSSNSYVYVNNETANKEYINL